MNFNVNDFLNDRVLVFRLAILFLLFVVFISPGLIMIYLFNPEFLMGLSEIKLFIFSAGLSIPLHLLAFVLIISSPATQVGIIKDPSKFRAWSFAIGVMLWAVLWVFLILALMKLIGFLFSGFGEFPQSQQIISTYVIALVYFICVSVFSFLKVTVKHVLK